MYLVHWPIILLIGKGTQDIHGAKILWAVIAMVISTLALSIFIELPFRYESFGKISPRSWLLILACATLVAQSVYLLPGAKASSKFQIDLSKPIIYNNNCHLNQRQSALSTNCTWGSTGPKVLLTGDSHAAQWFPALAELAKQNKLVVTSQTKSSCPITFDSVYASGQIDKGCDIWHTNIIKLIRSQKFDYVLISNFDKNNYKYSGSGTGINDFIGAITTGAKVVQLVDTPRPPSDSVACLSANPNSPSACNFRAVASIKYAANIIDPTNWLCSNGECSAVLNGFNTYRDGSHISVATSKYLAPNLYKELLKYNR